MRKILKLSSVLLVLAMLFSVLSAGFTVGAASASDFTFEEPNIISAELSKGPELATPNEIIYFTVVTDTNTSKVKICRGDGSTYTIANILRGSQRIYHNLRRYGKGKFLF